MAIRTIFANVVNVRVTPSELVFEFGTHFPDKPNETMPPDNYEPEIRVVLASKLVDGMAELFSKAKETRAAGKATVPAEKKESQH